MSGFQAIYNDFRAAVKLLVKKLNDDDALPTDPATWRWVYQQEDADMEPIKQAMLDRINHQVNDIYGMSIGEMEIRIKQLKEMEESAEAAKAALEKKNRTLEEKLGHMDDDNWRLGEQLKSLMTGDRESEKNKPEGTEMDPEGQKKIAQDKKQKLEKADGDVSPG